MLPDLPSICPLLRLRSDRLKSLTPRAPQPRVHVASPDPSCAGEHEVAFSARGLGILHLLPRPGSPLQQSVDAPEQCRDAVSLHQERTATGGQSCSVGEAVPPHHIRQQQVLIVTYAHRYKRPPGKRKAAALAMPVVVKAADRAKAARRATNDGGSQPPPPSAGRAATRGRTARRR